MAQLKDTLITGGLRVTDTTITNILLATAIRALTSSSGTTYGLGDDGLVLLTDGTSKAYWSSVSPSITITDGDSSNAPKINLTVLGKSMTTAPALTKASTDAYGVTKLANTISSTPQENVAATPKLVADAVSAGFAANDAMVFKGTLGTGGTITAVPTNGYSTGWTYRVIEAGVYAGEYCEVGDLLIAVKDGPSSGSSVIANDWTRALTNIEGIVYRGKTNNTPNAFTANRLIRSISSNGEVASITDLQYNDDGLSIITGNNDKYIHFLYTADSAVSNLYASWRLGYAGSGSGDNNAFVIQSTGSESNQKIFTNAISISMNTHAVTINGNLLPGGDTQTKNIGSADYKWNNIYGTLKGNADSATLVNITNTALPSSGTKYYYLTYTGPVTTFGSTVSGNLSLGNTPRAYLCETSEKTDFCFGSQGHAGGITLFSSTNAASRYGYLKTDALTAARTYTLPDASGTIALTELIVDSHIDVTARGTTVAYLLADTTSPESNHSATAVAETTAYLETVDNISVLAATTYKIAEKAKILYNTDTNAIDFVFLP